MKLTEIKDYKGTITVLTGLHIGAGNDVLEIGGLDNPIIKHPVTQEPYIPGSSIKGKMRSLLELSLYSENEGSRKFLNKGKPCNCGEKSCHCCMIFGCSAQEKESGPTRLIVRDAVLTEEFRKKHENGDLPMEVKFENSINRVTGVAQNPRPLERVPAGVKFDFSFSLKVFEGDPKDLLDDIKHGFYLIMRDALGGSSSRGCGQVQFNLPLEDATPSSGA